MLFLKICYFCGVTFIVYNSLLTFVCKVEKMLANDDREVCVVVHTLKITVNLQIKARKTSSNINFKQASLYCIT